MSTASLSSLNPSDVKGSFLSVYEKRVLGYATVNGRRFLAVFFDDEIPGAFDSLEGVQVVIQHKHVEIEQTLLDGRQILGRQIVWHVGGQAEAELAILDNELGRVYGRENLSITALTGAEYQAVSGITEGAVTVGRTYVFTVPSSRYVGRAEAPLEAPQDGGEYVRKNGSWAPATAGGVTPLELETRVSRADGGYEFTGGFVDRTTGTTGVGQIGDNVLYTPEMVAATRWLRFGFSSAQQEIVDQPYWGSPTPADASGIGLFGGSYMPGGVSKLFDFDFSTPSFNDAVEDGLASLQYTAADGSFDFTDCEPGDLALIRFDFNVTPQIANTTMEVALIWQTRDANGNPTFTFPLTGNPIFLGSGSVAQTFLSRPLLSAYFASDEDVNARALLAIRADNPIQIQPLTTLVTIQR